MFSLTVSVLGVAGLCVIGIPGIIFYFVNYLAKGKQNTILDFLLLITMVYGLMTHIFGFSVISLSQILDHVDHHSNTHQKMLPFAAFLLNTSMIGWSYSMLLLLVERYLLVVHLDIHDWLSGAKPLKWRGFELTPTAQKVLLLGFTLVVALLCSVVILLQYKVTCHDVGEGAHEDMLEICDSGERAYLEITELHQSHLVRLASKLSINIIDIILPCGVMFWCNTILLLAISNSSFSKCLLSFLNRKNIWRQEISERKLQPSEIRWVQGVLSASCLHSIVYITFLIMSGYEPLFDTPGWVYKMYEINNFVALIGPSLTIYIVFGPEMFYRIKRKFNSWDDQEDLLEHNDGPSQTVRLSTIANTYNRAISYDNPNYWADGSGAGN